jgi:hypothetical protein
MLFLAVLLLLGLLFYFIRRGRFSKCPHCGRLGGKVQKKVIINRWHEGRINIGMPWPKYRYHFLCGYCQKEWTKEP